MNRIENNNGVSEIIGSDFRLPYFEFGEGERVFVLIPGASMTSVLDSAEGIRTLFAPYTEEYRICVFDVPRDLGSVNGLGRIADMIGDALAVLGVREADVYGASMGGMVAQELAIRHPDVVRSLTLASSMSRNSELSRRVISRWAEISDPRDLAKDINLHVYSEGFYASYGEVFSALERKSTPEGVERMHYLARMILDFSAYDELEMIKCPVYVYAGSADDTLGVDASAEIAERLGCFIKIYEGQSHAVYDEYPGFCDDVFANLKEERLLSGT